MMKLECPVCCNPTVGLWTLWKAPTLWNIKCDVCKSVLTFERHKYLITGGAVLAGIGIAVAQITTRMNTIEFLALFLAGLIVVETLCSVMLIHSRVALVPRMINKDYQERQKGTANQAL